MIFKINSILLGLFLSFTFMNSAIANKSKLTPNLKSRSAIIFDMQGGDTIYSKSIDSVMPIASITKLMTAIVILNAQLPLYDLIIIDSADIDTIKNTRSRLKVGDEFTREQLLLLSLMSSENMAAAALGRTYPGGIEAFTRSMNETAFELGMLDSHFVDSTGLNSTNVSTARDLVKMVAAAYEHDIIREFSTTASHAIEKGKKRIQFYNTNNLVHSLQWQIGISKTGFINEAGRCLVMHTNISDKPVIIVLLSSNGKGTRLADANKIKKWMEGGTTRPRSISKKYL